jgi:hypothetical protein
MRVLNRRMASFLFAMLALCGTATWAMAEEPSLSTLPQFQAVQFSRQIQPVPIGSKGLKVIPPDVSSRPVRLVGHVMPVLVADNIPAGSVPTPAWSRPIPMRRSIVTVR